MPERERIDWEKTIRGVKRVEKTPFYEEPDKESKHGYFKGRRIIGRDIPINKGVYLGGGEREALVVDDEKYKSKFEEVYSNLLKEKDIYKRLYLPKYKGEKVLPLKTERLLKDVYKTVNKFLPFNAEKAEKIADQYAPDKEVSLTEFIDKKAGSCRHQALLAGYLLEKLIDDEFIKGKVSVDRNYLKGKGGHAWVRFQNDKGEIYILDPAARYIGKLKDTRRQEWPYQRPGDEI
jgi:hypothetical protein